MSKFYYCYNKVIMKNIDFEEGGNFKHFASRKILGEPQVPSMVKLLIKSGVVKDKNKAMKFLVWLFFVMVIASATLLVYVYVKNNPKAIPYEQMTEKQKQKIPAKERNYIEKHLSPSSSISNPIK